MLIKEEGGKINFIDKNDNFVGFDYYSCCCEHFGYFFSATKSEEAAITDTDVISSCDFTSDGPEEVSRDDGFSEENYAHFKCSSSVGTVYLTLYNHHNGYYSHLWNTSTGCEGYL